MFDEYYKSIYLRESSKAGSLGDLLVAHQAVIDYVHEQVGLYLHAQSEVSGQADALLTEERLRSLFHSRLIEEGYVDDVKLERLTGDLVTAARNRVVLYFRVLTWRPAGAGRELIGRYETLKEAD